MFFSDFYVNKDLQNLHPWLSEVPDVLGVKLTVLQHGSWSGCSSVPKWWSLLRWLKLGAWPWDGSA